MKTVIEFFQSVNFNPDAYWKASAILVIGSLLLGLIGRFVFGQKSILNVSVSSSFGILFIYGLAVILYSLGIDPTFASQPLPLITITDGSLHLIDFSNTHYTVLCTEILGIIILAFLVNLADTWLPKKKNFFSWLLFRLLTVIIGYLLYHLVSWLFSAYLPDVIVTYAPVVLLAILLLMLLTGSLKITIGAALSTVNPIIGGLYTFFFANIVGRAITKAVLTSAIIAGMILFLQYMGITAIAISAAALLAYLPIIILLILMWYLLCCIL